MARGIATPANHQGTVLAQGIVMAMMAMADLGTVLRAGIGHRKGGPLPVTLRNMADNSSEVEGGAAGRGGAVGGR